jgi:hypothetical protein
MDEAATEEEEAAQPAEDMPDWLSGVSVGEEEEAAALAEPVAAEEAEFDWMDEAAVAEEEAALPAEDMPDWLSGVSIGEEEEAAAIAEPVAAAEVEFDWMDEAAVAEEEAALSAEDMPDWLSGMSIGEAAEEEPAAVGNEAAQPAAEVPDWLSDVSFADSAEEEEAIAAEFNEEDERELDWMSEWETGDVEEAPVAEAEYGWDDEEDQVEPAVEGETPDWLTAMQSERSTIDMPEPAQQEAASEFDWIGDLGDKAAEAQPIAETTPEINTMYDEPEFVGEEELATTPAANAPDWLNAMVPGLDVDYSATEDDKPIEQEFVEEPVAYRQRAASSENAEFGWLEKIVEEETRAAPAKPAKRFDFVFSRLPAWLRGTKPAAATPPAPQAVEEPEWLRDDDEPTDNNSDDDDDLPDWLK